MDRSRRRLVPSTLLLLSILLVPLAALLHAQNGVTANESSTTIGGAASVDAWWADATDHRWKVNNNNNNGTNGADIAIWPCTGSSQTGGITYAGPVPAPAP